jgi:hypothetical protein
MTMQERLDEATAAVTDMHVAAAALQAGAARLLALDTPENVDGLEASTVRALRHQVRQASRVANRASAEVHDVHAALNDVAREDPVIGPMFGK